LLDFLVLDVTHFPRGSPRRRRIHPQYAGRAVEDAMKDAGEYEHSESFRPSEFFIHYCCDREGTSRSLADTRREGRKWDVLQY